MDSSAASDRALSIIERSHAPRRNAALDPAALGLAMRTLWDQPVLVAEMGRRARLRYEQVFTAQSMVAGYADLCRLLL